jgi:hypothetical protein
MERGIPWYRTFVLDAGIAAFFGGAVRIWPYIGIAYATMLVNLPPTDVLITIHIQPPFQVRASNLNP